MILDKIIDRRKEQLAEEKAEVSLNKIQKYLEENIDKSKDFAFSKILKLKEFLIIAEVKKASPSKGIICEDFKPIKIAQAYEKYGVTAISVLTEEAYFLGENEYLKEISKEVSIPILRKDFIIDEYQIYHSKYLGASIILLIVAILDISSLVKYLKIAEKLGLDVIVEVHTETEFKLALEAGAKIIGINNRDLKTFKVDLKNTERLMKLTKEDIFIISESGIKTAEDIMFLKELGVAGILIGETLMKAANIGSKLKDLGL